jgi:hypothetical protein
MGAPGGSHLGTGESTNLKRTTIQHGRSSKTPQGPAFWRELVARIHHPSRLIVTGHRSNCDWSFVERGLNEPFPGRGLILGEGPQKYVAMCDAWVHSICSRCRE